MSAIVWLASYPKSGNTWLRILLANYLHAAEGPVDINELGDAFAVASSRGTFDRWSGVEASALDHATVDTLRPELYRRMSATLGTDRLFVKVHDAWQLTPRGEPMFPAEATAVVIYVVRSPLDVASSLAAHLGVDAAEAVRRMCDHEECFSRTPGRLHGQLRQWTGSWSDHVRAWLDDAPLRRHVVRYEDLRAQPETVFGEIVEACGLPRDDARIGAAVRFSDFSELRRQEAENGFAERHPNARDNFFRSGRIGSWRDEIGDELADRIREAHGPMMDRMNYQ